MQTQLTLKQITPGTWYPSKDYLPPFKVSVILVSKNYPNFWDEGRLYKGINVWSARVPYTIDDPEVVWQLPSLPNQAILDNL